MNRPQRQIAGIYHRRIGDAVITALSDGTLERTHEMMIGVPMDEGRQRLAAACRDAFVLSVNAFLIYYGDRIALVETGSGNYLGPSAGHLFANLQAGGVDPSSIDTILLTHMHPDHSAGLTDMTTGKPHFANAELVMHENEPKHWFDDAAMAKGDEREKKLFFQAGREQVEPYRKRWRLFQKGEVLHGVTAMPFHGHTPGHTGYMISSGGQSLLIWGDIVHVPEVQTARPETCMAFDSDTGAAEATRRRVFDMVATDRLMVTGMHLHFPGFSHLVKDRGAYRLIPAAWEHAL